MVVIEVYTSLSYPYLILLFFFSPFLADFYQPFKEDEFEQSTEVPIIFPVDPKPVSFQSMLFFKKGSWMHSV